MNKYDDVILSIVCIGLHNKKSDPSTWFRDTLKDNCTWEDLRILLNAILFRIGYNPFYKSIMTLKNMSPLSEAESRPKKSKKLDNPVSSFMFLVNVKEALGYTHEQTLNSSYALITGMLQEYAYMCNERNKALYGEEDDEEEFEWVELVDFTTSEARRYKKYNNAKNKI